MVDRAPAGSDMLLCLGVIGAAHGVRGAVKVKTFTEMPLDLAAYGPLTDENGERAFIVTSCQAAKAGARITLKGVSDRDAAEALRGVGLYVARAKLPNLTDADDFYHTDLIGLEAVNMDGALVGTVTACHNFGAGDLLEINGSFYPFTKAVVPEINMAAGRLTLCPPHEEEARPPEQMAGEKDGDGK